MPTIIRLDQAIEAITLEVQARLVAAIADGELLETANEIVYGDRQRPTANFPIVWMFPMGARMQDQSHAMMEDWELPIVLVSLVEDEEPEVGYRAAGILASRARSVAKAEPRGMGLGYVQNIISTSFDPARQNQINNRTVYSAAATVTVRFNVYEP